MDEMQMRLSTKFMRSIVSKLITKAVYKKLGYKVDIQLKDLDVSIINGETSINTNVELKLDRDEFVKIMKTFGSE